MQHQQLASSFSILANKRYVPGSRCSFLPLFFCVIIINSMDMITEWRGRVCTFVNRRSAAGSDVFGGALIKGIGEKDGFLALLFSLSSTNLIRIFDVLGISIALHGSDFFRPSFPYSLLQQPILPLVAFLCLWYTLLVFFMANNRHKKHKRIG